MGFLYLTIPEVAKNDGDQTDALLHDVDELFPSEIRNLRKMEPT